MCSLGAQLGAVGEVLFWLAANFTKDMSETTLPSTRWCNIYLRRERKALLCMQNLGVLQHKPGNPALREGSAPYLEPSSAVFLTHLPQQIATEPGRAPLCKQASAGADLLRAGAVAAAARWADGGMETEPM